MKQVDHSKSKSKQDPPRPRPAPEPPPPPRPEQVHRPRRPEPEVIYCRGKRPAPVEAEEVSVRLRKPIEEMLHAPIGELVGRRP